MSSDIKSSNSIDFPETFSLIENPDETLEVLEKLAFGLKENPKQVFNINQTNIETVDFAAETIASIFTREGFNKLKIQYKGEFPKHPVANEIIKATGLPNYLGIKRGYKSKFLTFRLQHGRPVGEYLMHKSPERDRAIQKFYNYLNSCLRTHGAEFNQDGKDFIMTMLGEIIENSERHSKSKDWWISGYMRSPENSEFSDLHISIINFGETIYETLTSLDKNSFLRKGIEEAISKQKKNELFGSQLDEEQIWTLMALQEGVSRNNNDPSKLGNNGVGTVHIIDFFQNLGASGVSSIKPKLCILSGNTQIVHNCKYKMEEVTTLSGDKRMRLAFNEDNDIFSKPDPECVVKLKHKFPGTVYSFRFYLNNKHLKNLATNA